jgi:hypothetical protein
MPKEQSLSGGLRCVSASTRQTAPSTAGDKGTPLTVYGLALTQQATGTGYRTKLKRSDHEKPQPAVAQAEAQTMRSSATLRIISRAAADHDLTIVLPAI